ncbi:unnamed protein product [Clonostachys rosea]|uniref:C2H2-type domain-containing protein n=1 Tax=Bionectria ochroleuca TaxID=29856 RepID=A0ABY6V2D9_BIOOC|nr:unnamed protein product [Clonostachys rosea]
MNPSEEEPAPSLEHERGVSSGGISSSSLPGFASFPSTEGFISEGYAYQDATQSVWQPQLNSLPLPFEPLPPPPFENGWPLSTVPPSLNEEMNACPSIRGAVDNYSAFFHQAPLFGQAQLGGVAQQNIQWPQPLVMIPGPSPEIPQPMDAPSGSGALGSQANSISQWDIPSQIPMAESAATSTIAGALDDAEQDTRSETGDSSASGPVASASGDTEQRAGKNARRQNKRPMKSHMKTFESAPYRSTLERFPPMLERYPCTFCCDVFSGKHDWLRHEQSRHLVLEGWKCAPFGPVTRSTFSETPFCSYCSLANPTEEHTMDHEWHPCDKDHVYARKDNLIIHLRKMHRMVKEPMWLNKWKLKELVVTSRCGFCNAQLETWGARATHLSSHFIQDGKTMEEWEGDHGFTPEIAAMVVNAIPPHTIAAESQKPKPFSATYRKRRPPTTGTTRKMVGPPPEKAQDPRAVLPVISAPDLLVSRSGRFVKDRYQLSVLPAKDAFLDEEGECSSTAQNN